MNSHRIIVTNLIAIFTLLMFTAACSRFAPAPPPTTPTPSHLTEESTGNAAIEAEIVETKPITTPATVTSTSTSTITDTSVSLPLLQLDLPSGWTARLVDPAQAVSLPIPERDDVMALSAIKSVDGNANVNPTLLAMQYPRHGLGLEEYLAGVTGALGEHAEVKRVGIVYDLREDGKPVGILEYGNDTVSGYQVVQFDGNGDNLILLTFTVPVDEMDGYREEFNQIASAIDSR